MSLAANYGPVMVTGASGFVGACAVRRFLREGFAVHALIRPGTRPWRLAEVRDAVTVHEVDLRDQAAVVAALRTARPRTVLHLATYGAYESQADGRRILETSVLGTFNLLQAAVDGGARVFVNAGSSSEYGYRDDAMSESDRLDPNSVYAVGKAAQTHLVRLAAQAANAPSAVTFRLFSVYGPWEEPTRLFPTLIRRGRAGEPLEMVAPATARDFVYVEDVLDAFLRLDAIEGLRGEVVNLGSGTQSTMEDVVAAVQEALGTPLRVRWGAMPARRWDADHWRAETSRARTVLGWTARTPLKEGVARMVEWMDSVPRAYAAS